MSREALTFEEATDESRMAILDEIRQTALLKRYKRVGRDVTVMNEKFKSVYKNSAPTEM
jgi:aryl carrier-like protein